MNRTIFYLTFIQANTQKGSGVYKKIEAQIKAFNRAGITVYLGKYNNDLSHYHIIKDDVEVDSLNIVGLSSFTRDKSIINKVKEFLIANSISVVYTRWEQYSLLSANYYRLLKKRGIDVLLEVPTYPTTERLISLKSDFVAKRYSVFIRRTLAAIYGSMGIPFFKLGVSHIINNNGYDKIWNIPVLKITNAVGVETTPIAEQKQSLNEIRLISVANIADWHGYDRVLTGLKKYYSVEREVKVQYTVVGLGDGLSKLKSIVKDTVLENYVSFVGFKTGEELTQLFDQSNVGISILGIHRAGMKYIDTLKGREYCARAIPFITQETESMYKNKRFVFMAPDNDEPVRIDDMVKWYTEIGKDISQLKKEIRAFAETECTWDGALINVINYLR